MPSDPRKRQKRRAKQVAKRKSKHQEMAREKSAGIGQRLAAGNHHPILHCWATESLWGHGLGWVCVSREFPGGQVGFALLLLDVHCLGVKSAMAEICGRFSYDSKVAHKFRSENTVRHLTPPCTRKLVEGAVAYAQGLGLHPHPDYQKAKVVFGDIDASQCTEEFEFGKDGKPCFVAGPHDSPARCRAILAALEKSCGSDGYHYLIPLHADDELSFPPSMEGRSARSIHHLESGEYQEGVYKIRAKATEPENGR